MQINITARQISHSRPLPVISRFLIPGDRLQVSTSFAEGIIAKYKAGEGEDLPSVSFVYPETSALAAETLDRLAAQLITLNRIHVRMNVHNSRWFHNYALSLENSCRVLLNQLAVRAQASPGTVSSVSLRELERIFRETKTVQASDLQSEEETILRILTAASRGNGMRERYMAALYRRLQESAGPEWAGESSSRILQEAGKELFHIASQSVAITNWASEEARQFFWRVQRAPEAERELILKAGGYPSILSLEKELRTMDRTAFRRFSETLSQEIVYLQESAGRGWETEVSTERLVERMSEEDWFLFTNELKQAGFIFRDGSPAAPGTELIYREEAGESLSREELSVEEHFRKELSVEQLSDGNVPEAKRVSEEKRVFIKTAEGKQEVSEMLLRLLLAHTERMEIRNENRRAGEALSQEILNLTMKEWAQFREELRSSEIMEQLPGSFDAVFGEDMELTYSHAGAASAEGAAQGVQGQGIPEQRIPEQSVPEQSVPEQARAEQVLLEQGMRMSREKREMIRTIYELSRIPDHSVRDLERILHEQTVLREYSIRENSRQYFRSLSARERENWAGFVRELLSVREPGTLSPGEIYLRMNSTNTGAVDILRMTGAGGDTQPSRAEAAGGILEHLRETRITAAETIRTEYMDTPELIPADMDVPQRQAAAAQQAAAASSPVVREERTEYHDIEFETITRRTEEHTIREQSRDMKELAARLEQQEREIGRLQEVQERMLGRNIPGEVFRKLGDLAQMERLRGGR